MRIGLISDTHLHRVGEVLPAVVWEAFSGLDLILHAGDIYRLSLLDELEALAPVLAARGYGDPPAEDPRLRRVQVVAAGPWSIGLIHNLGQPETPIRIEEKIYLPEEPLAQVLERKFGQPVQVVVFGDTHEALIALHQGILLVNPGSPTYPGFNQKARGEPTLGLLEVGEGEMKAQIILLSEGLSVIEQARLGLGGV